MKPNIPVTTTIRIINLLTLARFNDLHESACDNQLVHIEISIYQSIVDKIVVITTSSGVKKIMLQPHFGSYASPYVPNRFFPKPDSDSHFCLCSQSQRAPQSLAQCIVPHTSQIKGHRESRTGGFAWRHFKRFIVFDPAYLIAFVQSRRINPSNIQRSFRKQRFQHKVSSRAEKVHCSIGDKLWPTIVSVVIAVPVTIPKADVGHRKSDIQPCQSFA
jgi:hypothetical protein